MTAQNREVLEAALIAQQSGRPAALATVIQTEGSVPRAPGSKMLIRSDGSSVGTVGGGYMESLVIQAARAALAGEPAQIVRYNLAELGDERSGQNEGVVTVFIEPLAVPPTMIVIGCGHVGCAVAELAKWVGFRVIAVDDRPGYATAEQLPGMDGYVETALDTWLDQVPITPQTCVVALTRSSALDEKFLPALLATDTPYIGIIGSRRRWEWAFQQLAQQGVSPADLARVHSPVGLDLHAETPREIALSILAEIVMILHGGTATSMQVVDEDTVTKLER